MMSSSESSSGMSVATGDEGIVKILRSILIGRVGVKDDPYRVACVPVSPATGIAKARKETKTYEEDLNHRETPRHRRA
jgi:hypothetical protein